MSPLDAPSNQPNNWVELPMVVTDTTRDFEMGNNMILKAGEALNKAEEVPSLYHQLDVVVRLGKNAYDNAPIEHREEVWKAFLDCIDQFRSTYGNLLPLKETNSRYTWRITDAMNREDTITLLKIFNEEIANRDKVDKFRKTVQGTPGVNFVAGIAGGAAEFGSTVATLAGTGLEATGLPGLAASPEEANQARATLATVGESLKHLDKLIATLSRSEEYKASIEKDDGSTTGYVLGKHYFDVASLILTAGGLKQAGRVAAVEITAADKVLTATTVAQKVARQLPAVEALRRAAVFGAQVGEEVAENALEIGAKASRNTTTSPGSVGTGI